MKIKCVSLYSQSPPKIPQKGFFVTRLLPAYCKQRAFSFIVNQLQSLVCFFIGEKRTAKADFRSCYLIKEGV